MDDRLSLLRPFLHLGEKLRNLDYQAIQTEDSSEPILQACSLAIKKNGWFNVENLQYALSEWGDLLKLDNLNVWLEKYDLPIQNQAKTVGIIMAGNIPLVGFHDLLSVFLCGHKAMVRLSSKDQVLIPALVNEMATILPELKNRVFFTDGKFEDFDAVIATGSNNTTRYFDYYFSKVPHLIRSNRTSIAILKGNETAEQLEALGDDIFRYFGLGCRNVSKVFVPKGFDTESLKQHWSSWEGVINNHKYANNFTYQRAVSLMCQEEIIDLGFLLIKKSDAIHAPLGTILLEEYDDLNLIQNQLLERKNEIQCLVSNKINVGHVGFGQTQKPSLNDYADGIDTIRFLMGL